MRIKRHDGPTRFIVESETGNGAYLVELESNGLTGRCNCKQFECRLAPEIHAGARGEKVRCKHIIAAREFYAIELRINSNDALDQVLREYAKTQVDQTPKPWPPPEPQD